MRKRIIFTVTNDLTYDQRMIRICSTLANQGFEVQLIGRQRISSVPLSVQAFQQKRLKCFFEKGKLFYLEYNLRLFFFLLSTRFDGICAIDLDTIAPAWLICRLRSKVLIYDAHEYFTEVPEVVNRPMVKKIWTRLETAVVPRLQYAYTVSQSIASLFEKKYGTPFDVIRNVPFKKKKSDHNSHKENIIIYQGALNEGRGLEAAIAAMQWVDAQLWLAGEGDLSDELRQLTEQLQLENKVQFKGFIQPAQLDKLTNQAKIGLNLLENRGLSYYYSLANKAFDYIQAGIPTINMDFPEYRRLNEQFETAVLLHELKPERIAACINDLLQDKTKYEKLRGNCQQAAQVFVWEKEAEKLVAFYQNIFR